MGNFTYCSNVTPGQLINLLVGMKPDVQAPFSSIVREGTREAIDKVLEELTFDECFFGPFPELVPCVNWSQLVAEFFARFKVKGRSERFASSAVLQIHSGQYASTAKELAERLGIHQDYAQDNSGYSFVLARVPRNIGGAVVSLQARTECQFREQLVKECTKTIHDFVAELEQDEFGSPRRIPANIRKALGLVEGQLGSHYVEEIEIGDEAFQVFVYKADRFKLIC
ncbi:MAG TPA: hypothetical protein DDY49_06845, partial [Paenibacillaceae bacterium]|nr:hypothetical protein [Paenibacillaceae bacterium]